MGSVNDNWWKWNRYLMSLKANGRAVLTNLITEVLSLGENALGIQKRLKPVAFGDTREFGDS